MYVPDAATAETGKSGLRSVDRKVWEDMLDIVKCKILSAVNGLEMDAYLLSESSLFISPHRLILKTCGTTLNLLGLPRILAIAREYAGLSKVYQCFYSRKAFMFPEKQLGPHRDWGMEVEFLDRIFDHGSAYTVGKVNGDHWLLYMTNPEDLSSGSGTEMSSLASSFMEIYEERWAIVGQGGLYTLPLLPPTQDYTIEILMTHLSPRSCAAFFTPDTVDPCGNGEFTPGMHAQQLTAKLGISNIFPPRLTQLDAYSFVPCGYSSNALIKWGDVSDGVERAGEGYYTIHVTPEEGWSYASFECNVPLAIRRHGGAIDNPEDIPDLRTLIQRVVRIFEPGKLTMTLFVASAEDGNASDVDGCETAGEDAQRAFKAALTRIPKRSSPGNLYSGESPAIEKGSSLVKAYKRTDKINYEFGGYDLAFASFEMI
ncbi:hypothetical protein EW145_g2749 [Phellinidium pouzarii]|uniref:adenosylmethionine decarboxylase n=1 Tax=Phellinidium pouzarii TaxID=167371 RepID=A0A4S4LA65_9AGAM|nr:hypothetical protein EW145_g2749 [Phellinidium pouzarii]